MTKRRARGSGSLTLKGKIWHMRYIDPSGKRVSESTGKAKKTEAQDVLKSRLAEVVEGRYQGPEIRNLRLKDLAEMVSDHYNGMASQKRVSYALGQLREFFQDDCKASRITYDRLKAYRSHRRDQGAHDGTVKYELAILRQAFKEALIAGKVRYVPPFPKVSVDNARSEFFTGGEFDALAAELPTHLRTPAEFAYWTGWRMKSEVLPLQWHQVDFDRGIVRLEPGTTKNKEGRELPFDVLPELEALLKVQRAHTDEVERKTGQVIPHVFHRNGEPIRNYIITWNAACVRSKVLGADGNP